MTKNLNTEPTNTPLDDIDEMEQMEQMEDTTEETMEQSVEFPFFPMVVKLMTGDELLVSNLSRNGNYMMAVNPYVVTRQIINNTPALFLLKWMPYTVTRSFLFSPTSILTVNMPNEEILSHYKSCLAEETMDEFQVTTNNYSHTIN
jgi:hypothetical protein